MKKTLITYFVVKILKCDVLKTDESQVDELGKDGEVCYRGKNGCE